ncbi:MAG: hypothetical protein JRH04_10475 [Deltaproteobacteria bacterium]|nr:hypothetical protein [Deltaproteobacteria bacterium]
MLKPKGLCITFRKSGLWNDDQPHDRNCQQEVKPHVLSPPMGVPQFLRTIIREFIFPAIMLKSIQLFPARWMRGREMKKKNTEAEINNFLKGQGIPISGISAIWQLPDVPEVFSPEAILKGAKSFICYGVPIPKAGPILEIL